MDGQVVLLWSEGHRRCELHQAGSERATLKIFESEQLIIMETVSVDESAFRRAEFLRLVFCGPPNGGRKN